MAYDKALDALGSPTRRLILERLRSGRASVGEIAEAIPVSRPAVSQHLKVLKEASLVRDLAIGARRLYEVDQSALSEVRVWLDSFQTPKH